MLGIVEALDQVKFAIVKNILNGYLELVMLHEVDKGGGCFHSNESFNKSVKVGKLRNIEVAKCLVKANPTTTGRILLVRFKLVFVLKMTMIIVDKVP
jgi:hypothetical protein